MKPAALLPLGLGLAGLGRLYLLVFLGFSFEPFLLCLLTLAAGLFLAAGGATSLGQARGRGLLALGLGVASIGALGRLLLDLGSPDLPGSLLMSLGLVQGTWASALWSAEDGAHAERRAGALQVSFVTASIAAVWYVFTALGRGNPVVMPAPLLLLTGLALTAWAWSRLRASHRPAAGSFS